MTTPKTRTGRAVQAHPASTASASIGAVVGAALILFDIPLSSVKAGALVILIGAISPVASWVVGLIKRRFA